MQVTVKGNSVANFDAPALMINPATGLLILTSYPLEEGKLSGIVIDSGLETYRKGIFIYKWEPAAFKKFEGSVEIYNDLSLGEVHYQKEIKC